MDRSKLIRKTYVMQLKEGKEEAYRASHNEQFWPEMGKMLKEHGAHNYCISLLPSTNQLFAYVEIEDEERWAAVASTEICQKWWNWMTEFIVFGEDKKPGSTALKEMFFLP